MGMSSPCVNCGADLKVCKECDWYNGVWISKDQYENRLKADLVSMLRFLWNDIENLDAPICDYASSDCISKWQVHEVIQQKISKLRGNEECGNIDG